MYDHQIKTIAPHFLSYFIEQPGTGVGATQLDELRKLTTPFLSIVDLNEVDSTYRVIKRGSYVNIALRFAIVKNRERFPCEMFISSEKTNDLGFFIDEEKRAEARVQRIKLLDTLDANGEQVDHDYLDTAIVGLQPLTITGDGQGYSPLLFISAKYMSHVYASEHFTLVFGFDETLID